MTPRDYQIKMYEEGRKILQTTMIVYLSAQERVGKTLPAIMIAEEYQYSNILVLTKKNAVEGWESILSSYPVKNSYKVTNYHSVIKLKGTWDLVILDESHNYISSFPKRSKIWKSVKKFTGMKPIIYISATPCAQGYQMLFNQFALSSYSPWKKYSDPLQWFKEYGIPSCIWVNGIAIPQYKKVEIKAYEEVKHLFISMTRKDAKFTEEPKDQLHYITLADKTKQLYNIITKKRAVLLNGEDLICDTVSKLRYTLHMIEGGVYIITKYNKKNYCILSNTEKINYILENWGDNTNLVIMYNYIAEETKLKKYFKKAKILQATSFAEGIDLYQYENLVIYSMDFSTSRYTQRRSRQANKLRKTPIKVHYLLVEKAISEQVYNTVAINKKNYVDSLYNNNII